MSDLFPEEIVTERLRLVHESLDETDLGELYASLSTDAIDDDELAYVPLEGFEHLGDAQSYVESREERWERGDAGTYAVRPRDGEAPRASENRAGDVRENGGERGTGELAGGTEIFVVWEERKAFFTIGLRKRFWGRGYSGERAAAFVRLAFERLDLDLVSVTHLVENENSRRAIEGYVDRFDGECDGRFRNEYVIDGDPRDLVRYTISQADYEASGERPAVEFRDDGRGGEHRD